MRHWMVLAALLLIGGEVATQADEKVIVEATREDISDGLDLKAVATLFGEVKNLSEFEEKLNAKDAHLNNLDLNGDGNVDYLRVIEVEGENNVRLVVIQAVLAKDIYQDIASIYVERQADKSVTVQVIGDAYIYGSNYVIEPVYIYRPVIYDWFWGPTWVCYSSPWYWGYWPGWYTPYPCWGYRDYWVHIHVYHYDHPCCSYRYAREAHEQATQLRDPVTRTDYAKANAGHSFANRTGVSNAREYSRSSSAQSSASSVPRSTNYTYGSRNTSAARTVSSGGNSSVSSSSSSRVSSASSSSSNRASASYSSGGSRTSSASATSYSSATRTSSAASYFGSNNSSSQSRTSSAYSSNTYSSGASMSSSRSSSGGGSYSGGGGRTSSSSMSGGSSSGRR